MSSLHDELLKQMEIYIKEATRFEQDNVIKSATGARNALSQISKLCLQRRKELLDLVKEKKAAK